MKPRRRQALLFSLLLGMLAVLAVWNVLWVNGQRMGAIRAAEDLTECMEHASVIRSLGEVPTAAATEGTGDRQLGERIAVAAGLAGLDAPPRDRFPQQARRVGNTPFMQKPTILHLRGVPLPQVTTFLYHLTADSALQVPELYLSTPRDAVAGNAWDARATLTYLVYAPLGKTPSDQRDDHAP